MKASVAAKPKSMTPETRVPSNSTLSQNRSPWIAQRALHDALVLHRRPPPARGGRGGPLPRPGLADLISQELAADADAGAGRRRSRLLLADKRPRDPELRWRERLEQLCAPQSRLCWDWFHSHSSSVSPQPHPRPAHRAHADRGRHSVSAGKSTLVLAWPAGALVVAGSARGAVSGGVRCFRSLFRRRSAMAASKSFIDGDFPQVISACAAPRPQASAPGSPRK